MTINFYKPYIFIGIHILGWLLLGFLLLFYIPMTWNVTLPFVFKIWQLAVLMLMIAMFYINAKLIVPKTIIKEKIGLYFIWVLLVLFVMQLMAYFYISYTDIHAKMGYLLGLKRHNISFFNNFIFTITLLVLGISTSWAMLQYWQKATQNKQKLEQDKTIAELAMLKAQINPHFFFNSLNSIYSLTYTNVEDSRKALHTLSHMMRYLLYNAEGERTTLLLEVEFLKNYISLMKLRANSKLKITTHIPDLLKDHPIVPMLLLPLVENAFKHGVNATDRSEISIKLNQNESQIALEVENTFFEKTGTETDEGGIGLTNTQRRLELVYPQKHDMRVSNQNGKYKVNLQITLEQ